MEKIKLKYTVNCNKIIGSLEEMKGKTIIAALEIKWMVIKYERKFKLKEQYINMFYYLSASMKFLF